MRRISAIILAAAFAFASAQSGAEATADPYADAGIQVISLTIDGRNLETLSYQGDWVGWRTDKPEYQFFKPHPLNKKAFWSMLSAEPNVAFSPEDPRVKSRLTLAEANCSEGSFTVRQYADYDGYLAKGKVLESHVFPKSGDEWFTPPPGTVIETWLIHFCSRRNR